MQNSVSHNMITSNTMNFTGNGQVTATPDITTLRLGVQTEDNNLTAAQTNNAHISQAVLQALSQLGITDIQTYQYDINKIYEYENNNQIDKGYSVRNIFEIQMNHLEHVGLVIDKAVSAGANVVEFISFDVLNTETYYLEALNLAVMNAYAKAKSVASTLGITINPIPKNIHENSIAPSPSRNFAVREGGTTTPIKSGSKQIEASVSVEFIY